MELKVEGALLLVQCEVYRGSQVIRQSDGESVMSILDVRLTTSVGGFVCRYAQWIVRCSVCVVSLLKLSSRPAPTTRDCSSCCCYCMLAITVDFLFCTGQLIWQGRMRLDNIILNMIISEVVGREERIGVEWRRDERSKTVLYMCRKVFQRALAMIAITFFAIMTATLEISLLSLSNCTSHLLQSRCELVLRKRS